MEKEASIYQFEIQSTECIINWVVKYMFDISVSNMKTWQVLSVYKWQSQTVSVLLFKPSALTPTAGLYDDNFGFVFQAWTLQRVHHSNNSI